VDTYTIIFNGIVLPHTSLHSPKIYGRFITKTNTSVSTALPSDGPGAPVMISILFDTEHGGRMFLQNTGIFLEDYMVAHIVSYPLVSHCTMYMYIDKFYTQLILYCDKSQTVNYKL